MMNKNMIKQAQQLQKRMVQLQEELETATVEGSAGGGVVKVVVTGKMTVLSVKIDPEAVSKEEVDLLEDLVLTAINDGLEKSQEMANKKMSAITGGMKIPGLM